MTSSPAGGPPQSTSAADEQKPGLSKRRDVLSVAIISIIAVMLGVNLFMLFDDGGGASLDGETAPAFELPVFDSEETMALENYRGQVVVMDFWATWCPPCREQMPALEEVATDPELADEVAVFSINTDVETDERAGLVETFLSEEELTLPTLLDDGSVQRAYEASTIPTLVVVAPDGRVTYVSEGVHGASRLRELIVEAGASGG